LMCVDLLVLKFNNDEFYRVVSTHLHRSQIIGCDVYVYRPPLFMTVYVQLFWSLALC